jgi:lipoprotein signal peptidase
VLALVVLAAALAADLGTKQWAWHALYREPPLGLARGLVELRFVYNTGPSLGPGASWALVVVGVAALAYVVRLAASLPTRSATAFVALGMTGAGLAGNLIDRISRPLEVFGETRRGVFDFVVLSLGPARLPPINVADVLLVAGVASFLAATWRQRS